MTNRRDIRKGRLVATVLGGAWRNSDFPPIDITEQDLAEITPLLCSLGVGALAWCRLSNTHLHESSSAEVLHQTYRLQSLQTAIQEEQIERVFRMLRAASVDAILAKGWAAAALYTNRDLRPCGDIDICVRPSDFRIAQEVFRRPEATDCLVDLHRHFTEISDRSIEEIFARSVVVQLGEEEIRLLGPEDHLALLCIHLLKHGAWRPLWLCDIAVALESLPVTFDWNVFLGSDRKRTSWIGCAVGLAHRLLGARIAQFPLRVEQTEVPAWLIRRVLEQWSSLFPAEHLPIHPAPLMSHNLRTGRNIIKGVVERWPDPITATFNLGGRFNNAPRLPYQLADFIALATRYLYHLPTKLQSAR
jgi:hypothetical protein